MTVPLLILGDGTFAIEALDIAEAAGGFEPLGFVNSHEAVASDRTHAGLPVFTPDTLPYTPKLCSLVCGIVSNRRRAFIQDMAARGYRFATLIHPAATVSRRASITEGCIIHAGVVVSSSTSIGNHVIVNRGALIGHDIEIGGFVTIGPGANIAGKVTIGEGAYIGAGAVIRDHLSIGTGSVVGAGAVVVDPVPPHVLVTGLPAKVIRDGINGL